MTHIERDLRRASCVTFCLKECQLEQVPQNHVLLNMPRNGESTASLGNLIQCLKSNERVRQWTISKEQLSSLKPRLMHIGDASSHSYNAIKSLGFMNEAVRVYLEQ